MQRFDLRTAVVIGLVLVAVIFLFRQKNSPDKSQIENRSVASSDKPSKKFENSENRGLRAPQSTAMKSVRGAEFRTLEDLHKEFGSGWSFITEKNGDAQEVRSVLVAHSQSPRLDENNVIEFIKKMRPVFGAPLADIAMRDVSVPHQYDFVQNVDGFEVYDGRVRVITDPKSSTPVITNNSLKPIEKFDTNIVTTRSSAEDLIQQKILGHVKPMTLEVQEKPVAFYTGDKKGELSWIVHAQWIQNRQLFSKDFVVSAVRGEILFERNLVDH